MVGSFNVDFNENLLLSMPVKVFENWAIFHKVMTESLRLTFWTSQR